MYWELCDYKAGMSKIFINQQTYPISIIDVELYFTCIMIRLLSLCLGLGDVMQHTETWDNYTVWVLTKTLTSLSPREQIKLMRQTVLQIRWQ